MHFDFHGYLDNRVGRGVIFQLADEATWTHPVVDSTVDVNLRADLFELWDRAHELVSLTERAGAGCSMTNDLAPTVAMGIGASLLAFETLAALASWIGARPGRHASRKWSSGGVTGRRAVPALWLRRPGTVREHLAARQSQIRGMRRQFPVRGSCDHARELRTAIRTRHRRHIQEAGWVLEAAGLHPRRRDGSPRAGRSRVADRGRAVLAGDSSARETWQTLEAESPAGARDAAVQETPGRGQEATASRQPAPGRLGALPT